MKRCLGGRWPSCGTDGVPLWRNPSLLADPWTAGRQSAPDAERLVQLPGPEYGTAAATPAMVVPVDQAPANTMCVEVRNRRVHVFLPPLERLEHAVELLAAVEAAASGLATPVVLEGYPLPWDPRVSEVVIGPDPA